VIANFLLTELSTKSLQGDTVSLKLPQRGKDIQHYRYTKDPSSQTAACELGKTASIHRKISGLDLTPV
jgi:hypothetical protein